MRVKKKITEKALIFSVCCCILNAKTRILAMFIWNILKLTDFKHKQTSFIY